MNPELAIKDLKAVRGIFTKLNLPLFLLYGTALGAYREKGFIQGDQDIDLGTFGEVNKDQLWHELEKVGFYKREGSKALKGRFDFRSLHVNRNVPFDIFLFEDYGEEYRAYTTDEDCCATLPKKFADMTEIEFYGDNYLVPKIEYIVYLYGDWKTPKNKKGR